MTQPRGARTPARLFVRRELAFAAALSGACVGLLLLCTTLKTEGTALYRDPGWDRHVYRLMAEGNPLRFGLAPFHHRVLLPLLAKGAPGGLQAGFLTVTITAAWASGVGIFLLARSHGLRAHYAAAGTLLFFSLGWGIKFGLADFWVPDVLVLAFVTAAIVAARRDHPLAFALIVGAGALAKESVLFVLPLYYTLNARELFDGRVGRTALLAAIPALAVTVVLWLAIPARNGDAAYFATLPGDFQRFPELYNHYNYRDLLDEVAYHQRWFSRDFGTVESYTVYPFGLLALTLCAAGVGRHWQTALRYSPFVALVYVQLLFATDTQRLIALAGPVVCLGAVAGAAEFEGRIRFARETALALCAAAFLFDLVGGDDYDPVMWGQILLGSAVVAASGVVRLRQWNGSPAGEAVVGQRDAMLVPAHNSEYDASDKPDRGVGGST